MESNKGYGIVIPTDLEPGTWDKLSAQEVFAKIKELDEKSFYRMAKAVGIELQLLNESGYVYDGVSEIALCELKAFISEDLYNKVLSIIERSDYEKNSDFLYVLYRYNDKCNVIQSTYSTDIADEIISRRNYFLHDERESVRDLMVLFINEFDENKRTARLNVLNTYGGHFIYIPEMESMLSRRDFVNWYRGDTFDPEYKEEIEQMKSMVDLVSIYKLLSEGGEFQIQSSTFKHLKVNINNDTANLLANTIAFTLKMLDDSKLMLSSPKGFHPQSYTKYDLFAANVNVDEILDSLEFQIESYEDEFDLALFYYLADNAITWPQGITITKRCMFLYRLAKFFKHIPDSEYDKQTYISSTKEIVDSIKYQLKRMKKKDENGELLDFYFESENSDL